MSSLMEKQEDICPVCNQARSRSVFLLGNWSTFRVLCDCEAAERDRAREEREAEARAVEIENNRDVGFNDKKLRDFTFENDNGNMPGISELCKTYAENFMQTVETKKGLLLCGSVGNGKTYMAAAIMNYLLDRGHRCLMTNMGRIINYMWTESDKNAYLDSLSNYALLVIDDFGAERDSDYNADIVFQVIDARYRSGLPLIITTNLTMEELKRPKDISKHRIYSRLMEMCAMIEVKGADKRIEKQNSLIQGIKRLIAGGRRNED